MDADERSRAGLFLAFNTRSLSPASLSPTSCAKTINAVAVPKTRTIKAFRFQRFVVCSKPRWTCSASITNLPGRYLNEGFSGGEKKRAEILQMAVLEPVNCHYGRETDSGLDIDALRVVAEGAVRLRNESDMGDCHHALPAPVELYCT